METLQKTYEYKFERIKETWISAKNAENNYRKIIEKYAIEGWRLVQIFAPSSAGVVTGTRYYEMIFEREKAEE